MPKVDGGELVARVMRENKARYCFSINGGHLFPILAQLRANEIKLIHMRHEQATAYAADAYARMTGEAGVCMVTAGCGLTNAMTGLCLAAMTNSAVVCVSGQHPNTEDHQGSFQEAYGSEMLQQLRQVHQARDRLEHDRVRHAPGFSRGDHAAAGRGAGRDSAEHPVPRR